METPHLDASLWKFAVTGDHLAGIYDDVQRHAQAVVFLADLLLSMKLTPEVAATVRQMRAIGERDAKISEANQAALLQQLPVRGRQ